MNEDHPIWQAIDLGGGQTCDISGVLRELFRAGYVIAPMKPTQAMVARGQGCLDCVPINRCVQQAKQVWAGMISVAGDYGQRADGETTK